MAPIDDEPSQQTPEPTGFDAAKVEECGAIVTAYRRCAIAKAEATLRLLEILQPEGTITEADRESYKKSYATFLAQLDEVDKASVRASERARLQSDGAGRSEPHSETQPSDPTGSPSGGVDGGRSSKRRRVSDDADSDADDKRSGKKPVDESLLAFNTGGVNLVLAGLTEQAATLLLKENYLRDVSFVKQKIACHADCPEVPTSLWTDIISNHFVDLDKLHTAAHTVDAEHRETIQLGNGIEVVAATSRVSKRVESHGDWINAWDAYHDAVLFVYPHRDAELRHYRNHINGLFKSIAAPFAKQVINVDRYIRLQVARSNRRLLSDTTSFQDAYTMFILPAGAAAPGASSSATKALRSRNGKTSEACRRWNDERCTMRDCRYRHACALCGGAHIASKCDTSVGTRPAAGVRK